MNNGHVRKTAAEWEIHGELAERLHHHVGSFFKPYMSRKPNIVAIIQKEAVEAFITCLNIRFSAHALRGLLQNQEKAHDNRGALNSIIRLTAWNYRWFSEV